MAEQMRVHGRGLSGRPVARRTQRQHLDVSALGGGLDDRPCLDTADRSQTATRAVLPREQHRCLLGEALLDQGDGDATRLGVGASGDRRSGADHNRGVQEPPPTVVRS
jgi:hypothetical protein